LAKRSKVNPAAPRNAFVGKTDAPNARELTSAIGPAKALWDQLVADLQQQYELNQEWGSYSLKAGWSLRLKRKDRIIAYLVPLQGGFQAALVLGDRAVKIALQSKLPERVLKTIANAKRYGEGTGIRLTVENDTDLAAIGILAAIKIEN
jgi:hypothetical protein